MLTGGSARSRRKAHAADHARGTVQARRRNHAKLTLKIEKMEKGNAPTNGQLELRAQYCAKAIPLNLDTTGRYRFYGNEDESFVTYEPIAPAKP